MNAKIAVSIGVLTSIILSGCSTQQNSANWANNQQVNPSQLPTMVTKLIEVESKRLGESNPDIISAKTSTDDATHKPMYDVVVKGNFVSDGVHKGKIQMIVMKDGSRGGVRTGDKLFDTDFTMTKVIK